MNGVPIKFRNNAQLCGYDGDGREVYEGDTLTAPAFNSEGVMTC